MPLGPRRNAVKELTTETGAKPRVRARRSQIKHENARPTDVIIDESLEESFPASDPPSWTVGTRIGAPK